VVLLALFNTAVGRKRKEPNSIAYAVVPEVLPLPPTAMETEVTQWCFNGNAWE
jgi:hypothetical protein